MDPSVKKIINNSAFIANLAPLIDTPEAAALATAARTYSNILRDLGIDIDTEGFEGCDQAQALVRWITTAEKADADQMNKWTADIWSAIADLAAEKLPTG